MISMKKMLTYVSDGGKPKKAIEIANILICEHCKNEIRYTVSCPISCNKCFATIVLDDSIFSNKKERLDYHDNYGFGYSDNIPGYMYI